MDSSIINGMVKIAKKYMKFQSVEGIGKIWQAVLKLGNITFVMIYRTL